MKVKVMVGVKGRSVETSCANEVDDVDGANMVSGGCIYHRSC